MYFIEYLSSFFISSLNRMLSLFYCVQLAHPQHADLI